MDEMVKEENANKKDKKQRYLGRPRLRGKLESACTQQYGNQQEDKRFQGQEKGNTWKSQVCKSYDTGSEKQHELNEGSTI